MPQVLSSLIEGALWAAVIFDAVIIILPLVLRWRRNRRDNE